MTDRIWKVSYDRSCVEFSDKKYCAKQFAYLGTTSVRIHSFISDEETQMILQYYILEFLCGQEIEKNVYEFNLTECNETIDTIFAEMRNIAKEYADCLCVICADEVKAKLA